MDNVEKINREEVGDRRKMEVEEGHLTIQWRTTTGGLPSINPIMKPSIIYFMFMVPCIVILVYSMK